MPIRPENRERYPCDWPEISLAIRQTRAKWRCECHGECGIDHDGRCRARHRGKNPDTGARVVLTVAHLDHTPENSDPANLRAMCQRCHNRYDGPTRRAGMAARRREACALGDLFA